MHPPTYSRKPSPPLPLPQAQVQAGAQDKLELQHRFQCLWVHRLGHMVWNFHHRTFWEHKMKGSLCPLELQDHCHDLDSLTRSSEGKLTSASFLPTHSFLCSLYRIQVFSLALQAHYQPSYISRCVSPLKSLTPSTTSHPCSWFPC